MRGRSALLFLRQKCVDFFAEHGQHDFRRLGRRQRVLEAVFLPHQRVDGAQQLAQLLAPPARAVVFFARPLPMHAAVAVDGVQLVGVVLVALLVVKDRRFERMVGTGADRPEAPFKQALFPMRFAVGRERVVCAAGHGADVVGVFLEKLRVFRPIGGQPDERVKALRFTAVLQRQQRIVVFRVGQSVQEGLVQPVIDDVVAQPDAQIAVSPGSNTR